MPDHKRYSNEMEKQVAKNIGGKKQINSGAMRYHKGDVVEDHILIECKRPITRQKSYHIKEADMKKIRYEAFEAGKQAGILVFNFGEYTITNQLVNYVALLDTDFYSLYERMVQAETRVKELELTARVPYTGKLNPEIYVSAIPQDIQPIYTGPSEDGFPPVNIPYEFLLGETTTFITKRRQDKVDKD